MHSVICLIDPLSHVPLELRDCEWRDPSSDRVYPVRHGIPRFVSDDGYAANFGDQWNAFRRTQLEGQINQSISMQRVFRGTEWSQCDLKGKTLLEIGCGAGRFTGIFLKAGAEVWAVDMSSAIDACLDNWKSWPNLHCLQADVRYLPFQEGQFDFVFMYGVLQHTPNPPASLSGIIRMARPGGRVAVDTYVAGFRNRWTSKYRWRWLTIHLPPWVLRRFISWYIPRWIRVDDWLGRWRPDIQNRIASVVPCWNYSGIYPLTYEKRVEWAILDTYDALAARYDKPFTMLGFAKLLNQIEGIRFSIKRGGIGLEANIERLAS